MVGVGAQVPYVEGRRCGTCTLCCKLFDNRALDKPQFEWCKHCDIGQGCKIYDSRPQECADFVCSYLTDPSLGEEWFPSKSKIVVTHEAGALIGVHVDPGRPDAWRREPYYSQVMAWAGRAAAGAGQVVVWEGRNAVALLPSGEKRLGAVPAGHHILFQMAEQPDGSQQPDAIVRSPDDPEWSQDDFDRALQTDQDIADAYFNRGLAYSAKGESERAVADITTAIEREPKLAAAWDARALARMALDQLDEALADSAEAIALAPEIPGFYNNRAMILSVAGETDQATEAFDKALALDPAYARAYFNRGNTRARRGDGEGAVADFSKAIEFDPEYLPALTERAVTFFSQGKFAEAAADFEAAERLDSDQGVLWLLWQHVCRARGALEQTQLSGHTDGGPWPAPLVAMFRGVMGPGLALTAAPEGDSDGTFFIGEYHLINGDTNAAIEHFRRTVTFGDVNAFAYDAARAELRRLGDPAP